MRRTQSTGDTSLHIEQEEALWWLKQGVHRQQVVLRLRQPMTAKQISWLTRIDRDSCSRALREMTIYQVVSCLTPTAIRSRLYWLTPLGKVCQDRLRKEHGLLPLEHDFPIVDWALYGWVCFSHRAAIVKTLVQPLQAAMIRRRARVKESDLRMSANNVRDVLRLFVAKGVVKRTWVRGKHHPRYELTETGKQLQRLLFEAESPFDG